jgi:hypothetical protein
MVVECATEMFENSLLWLLFLKILLDSVVLIISKHAAPDIAVSIEFPTSQFLRLQ